MGHRVKTAIELAHCDGLGVQHCDLDLLLISNALFSAGEGRGNEEREGKGGKEKRVENMENVSTTLILAWSITAVQRSPLHSRTWG